MISTDASGDVIGTQDFTVSEFGFPVETFTGGVEYSPGDPSNPLGLLFGNPYIEDISFAGAPGTLLPDNTGFLVTQFGGGWGNVLEEANITGSSRVIGDFLETPSGQRKHHPPHRIPDELHRVPHRGGERRRSVVVRRFAVIDRAVNPKPNAQIGHSKHSYIPRMKDAQYLLLLRAC